MPQWLVDVAGPDYAAGVLWTILALFLLVIVLFVVRIVRSMTFGTFVAGGRNRKTRLAVMDATAVDSHRRLVLVRRDDVEHLILIGGPTDVVVEQGIRIGQARRPAAPAQPQRPAPGAPHPAQRPAAPTPPAGQARPAPAHPEPQRPAQPAPRPAPPANPFPAPAPLSAPSPAPRSLSAAASSAYLPRDLQPRDFQPRDLQPRPTPRATLASDDLDNALVNELTFTLDEKPLPKAPASIEDEMNKLLGELASGKR
jgi:hypothetical protein